ncbi:hypothetical protein LMG24238_04977 [Paraburkholderia sediminicola]|uniref:Uncharacterized protein n=1 Tax=Paraburkholderia sediminicola TaxID=458836 RepID=A0A6J5C175_9BURK|nr:hypothetical protein [Paraburkholderia sediminicola]CAB3721871.1 hypothetical protein LMG24238_04977 [Paraburkholderia sediminicola]
MNISQFQWAIVAIGMVVGLSVTRILSGMIAAFRSRANAAPDLRSVVWAICIFLLELELWWGLSDLRTIIKEWTFPIFLLFISSPLLLFIAAALILPLHELRVDEDHRSIFRSNGRWALFAISAYYFESLCQTLYFWKAPLISTWGAINVALVVLPVFAFFTRGYKGWVITSSALVLTILFVFLDILIPAPV